jgi:hypothetical protein
MQKERDRDMTNPSSAEGGKMTRKKLEIGDLVSPSCRGKKSGGFKNYTYGRIVGFSHYQYCVRVKWDHLKNIQIVHSMLIEKSTKNRSAYIDQVTTDFTVIKVFGDDHEKHAERLVKLI